MHSELIAKLQKMVSLDHTLTENLERLDEPNKIIQLITRSAEHLDITLDVDDLAALQHALRIQPAEISDDQIGMLAAGAGGNPYLDHDHGTGRRLPPSFEDGDQAMRNYIIGLTRRRSGG